MSFFAATEQETPKTTTALVHQAREIPDLEPNSYCDATAGELVADGGIAAEQAYVRVAVPRADGTTGYLDFCGHHYAEHETAIVAKGYNVLDRRERLHASADGTEVS